MSGLWWLQPGWTDADCPCCGDNIWKAGGDPDMGLCPDCYEDQRQRKPEPEPIYYCDICGGAGACASVNGYSVCSEGCAREAEDRQPPATATGNAEEGK